MKIGIFQFNGCNKCFNECLLLGGGHELQRVADPGSWKPEKIDIAVITGYLLPSDKPTLGKLKSNAGKVIAYGNCATTGGVYGLAFQRGNDIHPLSTLIDGEVANVDGCLAEIEELEDAIWGKKPNGKGKLCPACPRRSTCEFLDEVIRQYEIEEDDDVCFNDNGYMCNGYIARACKEMCIKSGTPCRGCKPSIKDPGFRMLGMFATLMANVEVTTEATGKGGTDKLADEPDDLTRSIPDVTGSFFRFCLPASRMPIGKAPSGGNIISDVFIGRPVEELPLITGLLGGDKSISFTLDTIEAYEIGAGIEVSSKTKEIRDKLRALENDLQAANDSGDKDKYKEITTRIREIAGNMNLSNVFFGGFKTPVEGEENLDEYKSHQFEIVAGDYSNDSVSYTIDGDGMVTKFAWTEA